MPSETCFQTTNEKDGRQRQEMEMAKQRRREENICKECHVLKSVIDEGNLEN